MQKIENKNYRHMFVAMLYNPSKIILPLRLYFNGLKNKNFLAQESTVKRKWTFQEKSSSGDMSDNARHVAVLSKVLM